MYRKLKKILVISLALFAFIIISKIVIEYNKIDVWDYADIISLDMFSDKEMNRNSNYKILDVTNINQNDGYPTGCESVSAVMILKYYGLNISVSEFINNYLDKTNLENRDGTIYGSSPDESYIGDPTDVSGYGCYAPVIVNALRKYLKEGYIITNLTGSNLADLTNKYIDKDIPVMLWVTIGMRKIGEGKKWTLDNTGDVFTWPSGEHCMVLVGYDDANYYLNDPYNNNGLVKYEKSVVEATYQSMGCQAVVIVKSE